MVDDGLFRGNAFMNMMYSARELDSEIDPDVACPGGDNANECLGIFFSRRE